MNNLFIKFLTDSKDNPSSKRLTGFVALILWSYMIIMSTQFGKKLDMEVWYAVNGIIFWVIGMTTIESKSKKATDNGKDN